MRRSALVVVVCTLSACAATQPPAGDGGNYGLPPAGDAGQVLSLGEWDLDQAADPEGHALISNFAKAYNGQSVDFDGDDQLDFFVTREADGRVVRRFELYNPYYPSFISTTYPDGRETLEIDPDLNGRINMTTESDPRTAVRVELSDLDLNDKFEHRRTTTRNEAAGTELVVEEEDLGETGAWAETARYTLNVEKHQGTCAPGMGLSNFPVYNVFNEPTRTSSLSSTFPNIIIVGDAPIDCTVTQSTAIRSAMACALKKLTCLDSSSASLGARVRSAMSSRKLYIGCNNACPYADATTTSPLIPGIHSGRMNLRSDFETLTPDEQCLIVSHELMHFADVPMTDKHEEGDDRVYACARYCSKCMKRGPKTPPPSDMDDCVACAETSAERRKCGVKEEPQMGSCPPDNFCHAGLAGNTACATCRVSVQKDCKGNRLDDREALLCCETCPAGYTSPEKICLGPSTGLANTCNAQPPECP
jgi:hypothetical protein